MSEQAEVSVAQRLRELRKQRGEPPAKQIAETIGCAYRSYQNWELGTAVPSWKYLVSLGEYFGTSPEYILHGIDHRDALSPAARAELAAMNRKLDRMARALEALAAAPVMNVLREALLDLPRGAEPQVAPRSRRSSAAKGRHRAGN